MILIFVEILNLGDIEFSELNLSTRQGIALTRLQFDYRIGVLSLIVALLSIFSLNFQSIFTISLVVYNEWTS